MRLIKTTTSRKEMREPAPFGPAFGLLVAGQATKMEVWGTTVDEPGDDRVEFRLKDSDDRIIAVRTVAGY